MSPAESTTALPALEHPERLRFKEIRKKAKSLLNEYSNKIPDQIVSGIQEGKYRRYKVQKNWFNSVNLIFLRAIRRKELDDEMLEEYKKIKGVMDKVARENADRDDVKKVNAALKKLVRYCNRRLGLKWWHHLLGFG